MKNNKNKKQEQDKKVVLIGGGSGISQILKGFKKRTKNITAIISVTDDGGSTGRLRKDLGIIAPGDIRSCLVSLANADKYMQQLFEYRFSGGELDGHSFGNIFLAALNGVFGDFGSAIYKAGEILSITGYVYPLSLDNASLVAELENGKIVKGESVIPEKVIEYNTRIKKMYSEPKNIKLYEGCKKDILDADIIILGPGSLYTSVMPNLLAKEMVSLISESKAKVVYITNLVSQMGETNGYTVKEHYDAIIKHSKKGLIDAVLVNNAKVSEKIKLKYKDEEAVVIYLTDEERNKFKEEGVKVIEGNFVKIINDQIRHDSDAVAKVVLEDI